MTRPLSETHPLSFPSWEQAASVAWRRASVGRRKWRVWCESFAIKDGEGNVVRWIRNWYADPIEPRKAC